MEKIFKRILLVTAAIIILLIGAVLYNLFPLFSMNPVLSGNIANTNIYAVKISTCTVYLFKTDIGYIMIDAGYDSDKLKESLEEAEINLDDVKWILLTHSDFDHVAGLNLFPNAKIYMNEGELELLNVSVRRSVLGGNIMPVGINIDNIFFLRNDRELLFGRTKVKCIKFSGHTPGSMMYLIDNKYLFTGDAFKVSNGNIKIHPYTMDSGLAKKTIGLLEETINNSFVILTSHYGFYEKLEFDKIR
jgi:glyoxylase-like metal-dependent hydrolase (beta-lactamase superfamily II)